MVNICQPAPVPCFQVLKPFTDLHRARSESNSYSTLRILGF